MSDHESIPMQRLIAFLDDRLADLVAEQQQSVEAATEPEAETPTVRYILRGNFSDVEVVTPATD